MIAANLAGTDWAAVGAMTGVVALVVSIVTTEVSRSMDRVRRKEDARERVRFRQIDRRERQWLLNQQLEADRRGRLAKHYGAWLQGLTTVLMRKHETVVSQKHYEETKARRQELLTTLDPRIPSDDPEVLGLRGRIAAELAELSADVVSSHGQIVQCLVEVGGITAMIQVDDLPASFILVQQVVQAMGSWDGSVLGDGQAILAKAAKVVGARIEALRDHPRSSNAVGAERRT